MSYMRALVVVDLTSLFFCSSAMLLAMYSSFFFILLGIVTACRAELTAQDRSCKYET